MNLKFRINLIISGMLLITMIIGARMMVLNARDDIRAEVSSTARLAKKMLDTQILYLSSSGVSRWDTSPFHLQELANLRHLHIEFISTTGQILDTNQLKDSQNQLEAPKWLRKMLKGSDSIPPINRPIYFNGRFLGELVVTPDSTYEIEEVWSDTAPLLKLSFFFFVFVNLLVYMAVNQALKPVEQIKSALASMEAGNYDARLPHFVLPELESISFRFNQMASNLQQSKLNNLQLTKQLINMLEQERKSLALNLHDDLSQSLTAIQIEATSIVHTKSKNLSVSSAKSILLTIQDIRQNIRGIIKSLRPRLLDEFGLGQALTELISSWQEINSDIKIQSHIDSEISNVSETVAITTYRLIQESLTNIAKHADAKEVQVVVETGGEGVTVSISDDGRGIAKSPKDWGFGLIGMRERIEGLAGVMNIESVLGQGTRILAKLPDKDKVVV